MKRNKNLQELSRDHYHGLLLSYRVLQGLKRGVETARISRYVNEYADAALFHHFEEEEQILFPWLPDGDDLKQQALDEHRVLRELVKEQRERPSSIVLEEFGEKLEKHIRFEERILFPYMEERLSDEDLGEIGRQIEANHHVYEDNYDDVFWRKES